MKHLIPFRIYESQKASGLTRSQEEFLNKYTEETWSVNPSTGLVDVQGDFFCYDRGLKSLSGISFGHVSGDFYCGKNKLASLEGSPQTVGGGFYCQGNDLTSLEGAPQEINGRFLCDEFELIKGKWNMRGWLEVLNTGTPEDKKLILTLPWLQPDWWNSELQRDPGKTVHLLGSLWKHMPKDMQSGIKIPRGYEGDFELFSGFDELGLF
jgi:hypothetical protein